MPEQSTRGLSKIVTVPKIRTSALKMDAVNPNKFRQAFLAAQNGVPGALWEILGFFKKLDGHLGGDIQRRYSAVTSTKPSILVENETQEEWIEIIRNWLKTVRYTPMAQELLQGFYYGARAVELVWGYTNIMGKKLYLPLSWKKLPNDFLYAQKRGKGAFSDLWLGSQPLADYHPGKVLIYTDDEFEAYRNIDFTQMGRGLAAVRYSIAKYFNFEDWSAFNEVYGMPFREGVYDPNTASAKDIATLEQAVFDAGNDSGWILAEGTSLNIKEASRSGSVDAFESLKEACNREISEAILSQSITSSSGEHGTYGTSVTANGISLDVAQADAMKLDAIMERLIEMMLKLNGINIDITFKTKVEKSTDPAKDISIAKGVGALGVALSERQIRDKFGYAEPVDDDDILKPKTGIGLLG